MEIEFPKIFLKSGPSFPFGGPEEGPRGSLRGSHKGARLFISKAGRGKIVLCSPLKEKDPRGSCAWRGEKREEFLPD